MLMSRCCPSFATLAVLAVSLSSVAPLAADVTVSHLFADHMVLQRDLPIKVWGTAASGEKVTVTLGERTATATTDAAGKWQVVLDKTAAGGPFTLTIAGKNRLEIKDVLVGEVWVCSGQSNMNMPIDWGVFGAWGSPECTEALKKIDDSQLRMFLVDQQVSNVARTDVAGQWKIAKGNEVLKWSAAAYFFGVELRRELGVPVGLVKTAVGGTQIESWMRREPLLAVAAKHKAGLERWDREVADFNEEAFKKKLADWQVLADKAKADGTKAPAKPQRPDESVRKPTGLYNGMVAPLVPYTTRGFLWYQGESNAGNAAEYRTLFPAMIRDWRAQWGQGDLPFLFVQLANFKDRAAQPGESQWAEVREAQAMALSQPATAMAVIIDIGDAKDIHPKNKQDVGKRLSLAALKMAYGRDLVHSGPIYQSMKVEGNKVRLTFAHTGKGLEAKGGELKGFAIAGADKKFVWAKAAIDGQTVVVSADEVAAPVAVRYGWADNPECTLYNADGLPASPFRTDGPTDAK
jgi:sialate O-acetylesterase